MTNAHWHDYVNNLDCIKVTQNERNNIPTETFPKFYQAAYQNSSRSYCPDEKAVMQGTFLDRF